ncbi:MAG TPA: tetratricopeptide repeat protein [Bacteroidales bacterium]|nr:tetratricopeptide repeat protein [Bacteroidales bacterium]
MASLVPSFEYDIFISYRQNDNLDGWVTDFVTNLQKELRGTLKERLSVYFDTNPCDGLLENHNVDESLEGRLKCIILIPVISKTYCDIKSFAWNNEFIAFRNMASNDHVGLNIKLSDKNVTSRILPVQIHEISASDQSLFEKENGSPLRAISFIFKSPGVNRPLLASDNRSENLGKTVYRDQINKTANAIGQIITSVQLKTAGGLIAESHAHAPVLKSNPDATAPERFKKNLSRKTIIAILTLVVFLLVYFYYRKNLAHPQEEGKISIAVLPFENRSSNQDDEFFADGLTDEIIEHLSILGELHVINRQSIQDYRGNDLSYKKIASELNVSNILTGSVRRSGDLIKISATLIECATNKYIWGETFQRTGKDLMAVQSDIAKNIGSVLNIKINNIEEKKLDQVHTLNSNSYDYYLKGRTLYYRYDNKSNDEAVQQFRKAIELDPHYALAWAGLGDAYSQMHSRFGREVAWIDSSIKAGKIAVSLDPSLSEGYKALANAYTYSHKYDTAFVFLQKAVELNPSNAQAIGNLGTSYFLRGNLVEALKWEKKAAGLNPKNAIPFQIVGWIYRLLGDLPKAESWLEKSLELNSTSYWDTYEMLGYCYVCQGKKQEATQLIHDLLSKVNPDSRAYETAGVMAHFAGDILNAREYFRKSIDLNSSYKDDPTTVSAIGLGKILLGEGKNVEAEVYLTHALEINLGEIRKNSQDKNIPFNISGIYAILGQHDKAFEWLSKAIQSGWIDYAQLEYGPWFAGYRNDPRLISTVKTLSRKTSEMLAKTREM